MNRYSVSVHVYYTIAVVAEDRDAAAEAALAEVTFAPGDLTHSGEIVRKQEFVPVVMVEGDDGRYRVAP